MASSSQMEKRSLEEELREVVRRANKVIKKAEEVKLPNATLMEKAALLLFMRNNILYESLTDEIAAMREALALKWDKTKKEEYDIGD